MASSSALRLLSGSRAEVLARRVSSTTHRTPFPGPLPTEVREGKLILQQALEDEVSDFLGRARHAGAQETGPACTGYEPRTAETTGGPIEVERSRVRNAQALGMSR
jgi:hypothetical protein